MERIDVRRPTANAKVKLTDAERRSLARTMESEGYRALLKLAEARCFLQDARLLSINPADHEQIVAEHHISVAKWEFFEELQAQAKNETEKLTQPTEALPKLAGEDSDIPNILNPLQPSPYDEHS